MIEENRMHALSVSVPGLIVDPASSKGYYDLLADMGTLLDRCVCAGSHVLAASDSKGGKVWRAVPVLLYRTILEHLDAIAVLIRAGIGAPSESHLRTMLEARFGMEYILETDCERRALAYIVSHAQGRLSFYRRVGAQTDQGKQFAAAWRSDADIDIPLTQADTTSQIDRLEKMLRQSEYALVDAEWRTAKKKRGSAPNWFSLFNGPQNVLALAKALKREVWYDIMYRPWSGGIHAADSILDMLPDKETGNPYYRHIRHPESVQRPVSLGMSFFLYASNLLLKNYCPERSTDFAQWYVQDARDLYMRVSDKSIIQVNE